MECNQANCLDPHLAHIGCGSLWLVLSPGSMAGLLAERSKAGMDVSAFKCSHRFWSEMEGYFKSYIVLHERLNKSVAVWRRSQFS